MVHINKLKPYLKHQKYTGNSGYTGISFVSSIMIDIPVIVKFYVEPVKNYMNLQIA